MIFSIVANFGDQSLYARDAVTDFCQTRPMINSKVYKMIRVYFMDLKIQGQTTVQPVSPVPASLHALVLHEVVV